jgi:hypothetical protein
MLHSVCKDRRDRKKFAASGVRPAGLSPKILNLCRAAGAFSPRRGGERRGSRKSLCVLRASAVSCILFVSGSSRSGSSCVGLEHGRMMPLLARSM